MLERLTKLDGKARVGLSAVSEALDAYDKIATQQHAHVYAAVAAALAVLELTGVGQSRSGSTSAGDWERPTPSGPSSRPSEQTIDGATLENAPKIGFEQVLSPGLYFVWGIDRFAVGLGASMVPRLRKITSEGAIVDSANAFRFGAFLAIDVTIFPF